MKIAPGRVVHAVEGDALPARVPHREGAVAAGCGQDRLILQIPGKRSDLAVSIPCTFSLQASKLSAKCATAPSLLAVARIAWFFRFQASSAISLFPSLAPSACGHAGCQHNAPSKHWTISAGCRIALFFRIQASTAISLFPSLAPSASKEG